MAAALSMAVAKDMPPALATSIQDAMGDPYPLHLDMGIY